MALQEGGFPIEEEKNEELVIKEHPIKDKVAKRTHKAFEEISNEEQMPQKIGFLRKVKGVFKPSIEEYKSPERVVKLGNIAPELPKPPKLKAESPSYKKQVETQALKVAQAIPLEKIKQRGAVERARGSGLERMQSQWRQQEATRVLSRQQALSERQQQFSEYTQLEKLKDIRRQQVMPTAMQVIGKTPFEQQAQQRAAPQGRDYGQFTQGVGMNIPSPTEGVGRDFGAIMRPSQEGAGRDYGAMFGFQQPQAVVPQIATPGQVVPQQAPVQTGRDYGALFMTGANRFGDLLRGTQQVPQPQGAVPVIREPSMGDRFGALLRGPMQAVTARPVQRVKGKTAPKRMAAPKRVGSPFAKLLRTKKNKPFNWFG